MPITSPPLIKKLKLFAFVAIIVTTLTLSYKSDEIGHLIQGNLLGSISTLNHTPVDGFEANPIQKIPDWAKVGYNSNSVPFKDFNQGDLISPPPYDVGVITSNKNDAQTINARTTYTTLNSGSYGGSTEFSGSHTGVDIVAPYGTPLVAVANGVVIKKEDITTGFGKNLSILHKNVPADSTKEYLIDQSYRDYISSYAHLSGFAPGIEEGVEVKKGQVIGYVGDTGSATTYHVHFQIQEAKIETDTNGTVEKIPFIMYWGGGVENNRKFTINPLLYLQTNAYGAFNNSNPVDNNSSNDSDSSTPQASDPLPTPPSSNSQQTDQSPVESAPIETPKVTTTIDTSLFVFELSGETTKLSNGQGSILTISDSLNSMAGLDDSVELEIEVSGVGKTNPKRLTAGDFKNGKATVYFSSEEAGVSNISVGKSTHSVTYFNRDEVGSVAKLGLEFEKEEVYKNTSNTLYVKALDLEGRLTPLGSFPGTISFDVTEGSATFTPSTLSSQDFSGGIAKVEVLTGSESRLEFKARDGAIVSDKEGFNLRDLKLFSDVPENHPHAKAIYALREAGVISGNPDGTFKPDEAINRVATLKILMLAAGVNTNNKGANLNFKDVQNQAWYIPTLMAAVDLGIVEGYPDGTFKPDNNINNAELAKVLLESFGVEVNEDLKVDPYSDVSVKDWFAKYAYMINKRHLKDVKNNHYEPAKLATRAEVAEMAYRLKLLLEKNMVSYVE